MGLLNRQSADRKFRPRCDHGRYLIPAPSRLEHGSDWLGWSVPAEVVHPPGLDARQGAGGQPFSISCGKGFVTRRATNRRSTKHWGEWFGGWTDTRVTG